MGNRLPRERMEKYREMLKGKFSDTQIRHMHKRFYRAAPSGRMRKKEFKRYVDQLGAFRGSSMLDSYDHLFRGYDLDRDGIITFEEFLRYHLGVIFSTDELFDIVFAMYDVDGNGYITREELMDVIGCSTKWMDERRLDSETTQQLIALEVEKLVALVDVNNDGQISKEELYAAAEKHPEILEKLKCLA